MIIGRWTERQLNGNGREAGSEGNAMRFGQGRMDIEETHTLVWRMDGSGDSVDR